MAINFDLGKLAAEAGKGIQTFVEKTASDVVKAIDQSEVGKLNLNDVQNVVDRIGASIDDARRKADFDRLKPIFPDEIIQPDFVLSKMIRITQMSKEYAENVVCKGAIGYKTVCDDMVVINIFRPNVDLFGLKFFPTLDNDVYYVDPTDRNYYIALDEYFSHMKVARVSELQRIAQLLGVKHFRVTYKEMSESTASSSIQAMVKAPLGLQTNAGANAEHSMMNQTMTAIAIEADMSFPGHHPVEPELVYLQHQISVVNLIALRMDPSSPLQHQRFSIELKNSSGIRQKDAVKIDAALRAMKVSGSVNMVSETKNEARKLLEYDIDF